MNKIIPALLAGIVLCTTPVAHAQFGGMKLDQRNMNLYTDEKPRLDFASIDGQGTISMIDGHHQAAYFDDKGRIVFGTGRFEYKAKSPRWLYVDYTFQIDGHETHGGIHVSDMIVSFRLANGKPDVFINQLKLANNTFEYAVIGKGNAIATGATVVKETSVVDGRLRLQLLELKGSEKNQWFVVHLDEPLRGTLLKCGSPPRTLMSTKTESNTENHYPLGKTAAAVTYDAVTPATNAARHAVLADLQKQVTAISCAGQCFIGSCAKVVSAPIPIVNAPVVVRTEHLLGLYMSYTATATASGTVVVECQCK